MRLQFTIKYLLQFQLSACMSCVMLGLLCLNLVGTLLELCFKSFAVRVELIFPSALKSICLGRLSLKLVHYSGRIWAVSFIKGSHNLTPDFQNSLKFAA